MSQSLASPEETVNAKDGRKTAKSLALPEEGVNTNNARKTAKSIAFPDEDLSARQARKTAKSLALPEEEDVDTRKARKTLQSLGFSEKDAKNITKSLAFPEEVLNAEYAKKMARALAAAGNDAVPTVRLGRDINRITHAYRRASGQDLRIPHMRVRGRCSVKPKFDRIAMDIACPVANKDEDDEDRKKEEPVLDQGLCESDFTPWFRELKLNRYARPPSESDFRTAKYRHLEEHRCRGCHDKKVINPFTSNKKKAPLSAGAKRKIMETWGKMWDSELSDLQFSRIAFEHNPDSRYAYKSENERINDGCRKLWSLARMNQNIVTMMMKKFVSGPSNNKLVNLNRVEAAQCWKRIIDRRGLVKEKCCVDVLEDDRRKFHNIPSLRVPKTLRENPGVAIKFDTFRLPEKVGKVQQFCYARPVKINTCKKRNPTFWLQPNLVPPVPEGFKEEEFFIDPKDDSTGVIRKELAKAKQVAKRYTRFAKIIEKSKQIVPHKDKINKLMDEHFVVRDPVVRRQTLIQNFFASQKIQTSPEFKRDAMYATILSRNDNPKDALSKKPYPYNLAEFSKTRLRRLPT